MNRTHWGCSAALIALMSGGALQSRAQDANADAGALFQKLDRNGDGKLQSNEIPEDQLRFFERLVRRGDKNSDGELTREEFDQANKPDERPNVQLGAQGESGRGNPRQAFEMLDRNKDGKLTVDELPEPVRDRLKPVFERLGKQELTFEEFRNAMAGVGRPEPGEMFKRLDVNSDGKLTRDEVPAEMRERVAPAFERIGKNEITREEFVQFIERARAVDGMRVGASNPGQPGGNPEEMFARLDTNGDGKLTIDEVPERARPLVEGLFRRLGKEPGASVDKEEFVKNFQPPSARDAARRTGAEQSRAETPRSGDGPPRGERRAEGDQPRNGEQSPEVRRQEGRGPVIFQQLDSNRDGRLSKEELAKIVDRFDELDTNHDGQLDLAELVGPIEARDQSREAAEARDKNARREGAAGRTDTPSRDAANQRRESATPAGDAVSKERGREGTAPGEPGPFFKRLDRDGDGKISKDEAPERMKERFSMFDTNGDGFISFDEFRAGAQLLGDAPRGRQPDGRTESPPKRN